MEVLAMTLTFTLTTSLMKSHIIIRTNDKYAQASAQEWDSGRFADGGIVKVEYVDEELVRTALENYAGAEANKGFGATVYRSESGNYRVCLAPEDIPAGGKRISSWSHVGDALSQAYWSNSHVPMANNPYKNVDCDALAARDWNN
jgi:hypothetical protein